jgi:hypothetical protein
MKKCNTQVPLPEKEGTIIIALEWSEHPNNDFEVINLIFFWRRVEAKRAITSKDPRTLDRHDVISPSDPTNKENGVIKKWPFIHSWHMVFRDH